MKILIVTFLLLSGCTVYESEWKQAEQFCANNGGVASIRADTGHIKCKNNAAFLAR